MSKYYKTYGQFVNLFSGNDQAICQKIYQLGADPLKQLEDSVDLTSLFRRCLDCFRNHASVNRLLTNGAVRPLSNRGRPGIDPLLMLKLCFVQITNNWSDKQTIVQSLNSVSIRRFLDIDGMQIPSPKTLWKYRNHFESIGLIKTMSESCMKAAAASAIVKNDPDRAIDSSFSEPRIQRNTAAENKAIKARNGATLWTNQPAKRRQKDIDARWTKKGGKSYFGYKMHTKIAVASKLILQIHTTPANVHDSQIVAPLLNKELDADKNLYADSAYVGDEQQNIMRAFKMIPKICERAYRNKPLTDQQKASNHSKASKRCRIEHVFGFIENSLNGAHLRTVGFKRAEAHHYWLAFVYNLFRIAQIAKIVKEDALPPLLVPAQQPALLTRC